MRGNERRGRGIKEKARKGKEIMKERIEERKVKKRY